MDFLDQIKKLRSNLDEATVLFGNTKIVLEEERRTKENVKEARW